MTTVHRIPSRDDVRLVLTAAADVLFSDGVPDAFIDQWIDETVFLLSVGASAGVPPTR
jgi:hypothetical protein